MGLIITDFTDKCGYGGIVKIILTILVFIILLFQKITLKEIIWNVFILNVPCLIDCIEFSYVPKSDFSKPFHAFRGVLIFFLTVAILGASFIFLVLVDIIEIPIDKEDLILPLKYATSLSVCGAIFNYIGKIHTKDYQVKQSDKS